MDKEQFESYKESFGKVKQGMDTYTLWKSRAGYVLLIIVALLAAGYGGFRMYSKYKFQKYGLQAEAEVIDYREVQERNSKNQVSITYIPIMRFLATSGEAIVTEYNVASNPPEFGKGEHVTVYYFAEEPNRVETGYKQTDSFLFGALIGIGVVIAGVGAFRISRTF